MSLEKTALRSAAIFEVGEKLDTVLEAGRNEMYRCEGAKQAGQKAMERALQLTMAVDREVEEGTLTDDQAQIAKRYLAKAHAAMRALYEESANRTLMAQGMVLGMERAVKTSKVIYDREQSKVGGSEEAVPAGPARETGEHPKLTVKQQRLAEEAAAQAMKEMKSPNGKSNGAAKAASKDDKPTSPAKKKTTKRVKSAPKKKRSSKKR